MFGIFDTILGNKLPFGIFFLGFVYKSFLDGPYIANLSVHGVFVTILLNVVVIGKEIMVIILLNMVVIGKEIMVKILLNMVVIEKEKVLA